MGWGGVGDRREDSRGGVGLVGWIGVGDREVDLRGGVGWVTGEKTHVAEWGR